ncbi:uncharacterized protein LOC110447670 [Mizuhopecten yessoensis]|uniref:Uncharacterized protein n=1 Tax=Mizuhopecten yessoensis TaxID=6573 RepID=A0A210QUS7_MIZYE|nr:uncharacterized protein LOC110447670 [Mizuhopecten yessoensis]OWF52475.1 hypothetical protein KP79_PYT06867 [Mizuhopecten yessoensis]
MESSQISSNSTATDRINSALATLRRDMLDLRQQDVQLMQQLIRINANIKTLTKRRPNSGRQRKTKYSLLNGRKKFISLNESIPEEDSSSADSDSDASLSGNDN